MQSVGKSSNEVQPVGELQQLGGLDSHQSIPGKEEVQPKNRKWSDQQHARYILFLELNREKIKSKLIRRSNSFYQDMAAFVGEKSGVQCRSHHQKYQVRYKYPHRIIREEKAKIDQEVYNQVKSTLSLPLHPSHPVLTHPTPNSQKTIRDPSSTKTISCQTEIQGVDKAFLNPQQLNDYNYWLHQCYGYPQPHPAQLMMQWETARLLQMGMPYMHRPF